MEIQVGEYARTSKGKIFKYSKGRTYLGKDNQIVKHSFNIKKLIEVGDYVNGYLVIDIDTKNNKICLLMPFNEDNLSNSNILWKSLEKSIKSIVTKEQFQNVSYEV